VGFDAVGVGQGELSKGLFPAGHDLPFDESSGRFTLTGWLAAFLLALPGSFVLDVADSQPEQFADWQVPDNRSRQF
jgi:hypothetical protein